MFSWREKRLRNIARHLTHFDLQKPDPETRDISASEIEDFLFGRVRAGRLFLNFYSRSGLIEALERYGTIERLRQRDFDPRLTLKNLDRQRDMLRVRDGVRGSIMIELIASLASLKPRASHDGLSINSWLKLLAIEWLLLQNPRKRFTGERPRLPGQRHPGLGIGREVMTLLEIMANRLEQEGLLAFPEHYHNGLLYDRRFRYFSPAREGELHALEQALAGLTLAEASWAVHNEIVIDEETGKPYQWRGEEMIMPLSQRLTDYFRSDYYLSETAQAAAMRRFSYDQVRLNELKAQLVLPQTAKN